MNQSTSIVFSYAGACESTPATGREERLGFLLAHAENQVRTHRHKRQPFNA